MGIRNDRKNVNRDWTGEEVKKKPEPGNAAKDKGTGTGYGHSSTWVLEVVTEEWKTGKRTRISEIRRSLAASMYV